jgi:tetraacyldisaccharide 4'-kinase
MITPRRDPEILLRRYWDNPDTPMITAGLSVLSLGYRMALATRERAYRLRLLGTGRLPCPVVSVGNITVGGSGKTPMVEQVALCLRELGATPAIVSRGYGRDTRGVRIVADREGPRLAPRAAGDEPVLLADHLPGVPVIVGENRFEAGQVAVEQCGAASIVLDDGFQHRTLRKDLEILVVNGSAPWGNRRLFPRGMLREPLSALERADLFVVTNPRTVADTESATDTIRRRNTRAPILVGSYQVVGALVTPDARQLPPGALSGCRLLAFAGLGSPRGFAHTLAATGVDVAGLVEYPDHYWFAERDLDELARHARAIGAEGLVTTEKDWIRLRSLALPSVSVYVLRVQLHLDAGREQLVRTLERALTSTAARR